MKRLTIAQFVYCNARQAGKLCGIKGNTNGYHLYRSQPRERTIAALAKWFGGDMEKARKAIAERQKHFQKMQEMTPEQKGAIAKKKLKARIEVNLLLIQSD